ncbi:MAG: MBOAT family protein [Lachnospiraceae bacterium]|nr:MBOAT family protein [Lachnospiraceae bacterium]
MVFSSIPFLYFFLPACLILYYAIPAGPKGIPFKNTILLIFSLVFYAFGEPVYIILLLSATFLDYICGLLMHRFGAKTWKRRMFLLLSVCVNLSVLGFFKYADFAISTVNSIFKTEIALREIPLPIGISFFTFQSMSYVIDLYRKKVLVEKNYFYYLTYVSMFPQLIAGPIVRFSVVQEELHGRSVHFSDFREGMQRFLIGLFRKVLIANQVGKLWEEISGLPAEGRTVVMAWLGAICFVLQLYFDFSAYSDMAIGLGRMLGFHFPENFNYPLLSTSITDFWRRWHISLSTWFRDYVYIPLGGNRVSVIKHLRNMLLVWFLTGMWHGAFWNYILWGLINGFFLCMEKYVWGKKMEKWPRILQRLYSLFVIHVGFVVFALENSTEMVSYLKSLFGLTGAGFVNKSVVWSLMNYGILLAIAILLALGFAEFLRRKIKTFGEKVQILWTCVGAVGKIILFLVCTGYLIGDTYNPFLYFRF